MCSLISPSLKGTLAVQSSLSCFLLQAALQDSQVELETYKQTRQGLDEMYNVVWKQYKEEKRIRQVRYQNAVQCVVVSVAPQLCAV